MRSMWTKSLALSLGLTLSGAHAQEVVWRSQAANSETGTPRAAATLGKPVVIAATGSVPTPPSSSSVSLGRPVPIAATAKVDSQVRPVGFSLTDPLAPVVRGQAADATGAQPMPIGGGDPATVTATPPGITASPTLHGWRRSDEVVASTEGGPAGSIVVPGAPSPNATVLPQPFGVPTIMGLSSATCPTCAAGGVCDALACPSGCDPRRWYGSTEYLYWWLKGDKTPPLVTSGNPNVDGPNAAIIGQSTTQILYGGKDEGTGGQSGFRFNAGYWFCDDHCLGLDVGGFIVSSRSGFGANSLGNPALGRPINDQTPLTVSDILTSAGGINVVNNPLFGQPNREIIALLPFGSQGGYAGGVSIVTKTSFWGAEANLRHNLLCGPDGYLDVYVGYRTLGLEESLGITESLAAMGNTYAFLPTTPLTPVTVIQNGTQFVVNDKFATSNLFNGGQVGLSGEWRCGNWSLGGKLGIAVGSTSQTVDISGYTVVTPPGGTATASQGGLLALQGTNIGHYSRNMFTVVPEAGLNIGYQFCPWCRGFVAYNYLYWSDVVRPGEQIDLNVNRTYAPGSPIAPTGTAVPSYHFNASDFWAQGVSVGLEFRF